MFQLVVGAACNLWERLSAAINYPPNFKLSPLIEVMMGGGLIVAGKPLPQKATPSGKATPTEVGQSSSLVFPTGAVKEDVAFLSSFSLIRSLSLHRFLWIQ